MTDQSTDECVMKLKEQHRNLKQLLHYLLDVADLLTPKEEVMENVPLGYKEELHIPLK